MNQTQLIGRLTKDAELRYTPNGVAVANFTLAVNRSRKNQNGETEADFLRCMCFKKTAENLAQYCKKGSKIAVIGSIQTRSYENQQGQKVFMTEILANQVEYLDTRNSNNGNSTQNQGTQTNPYQNQNQGTQQPQQPASNDPFAGSGQPLDINDDDLPF